MTAAAEQAVDVVPGEAIAAVYGDPSADLLMWAARVEEMEPVGADALRAYVAAQLAAERAVTP